MISFEYHSNYKSPLMVTDCCEQWWISYKLIELPTATITLFAQKAKIEMGKSEWL